MPLVRTSPCAVLAVCPCGSIACHHAPIWPLGAHIQTARHGLQLPVRRLRPFAWASPPTPLRNIRSLLNCSVDFPCSSLNLSICLQRCPADCRRAAAVMPPRPTAPGKLPRLAGLSHSHCRAPLPPSPQAALLNHPLSMWDPCDLLCCAVCSGAACLHPWRARPTAPSAAPLPRHRLRLLAPEHLHPPPSTRSACSLLNSSVDSPGAPVLSICIPWLHRCPTLSWTRCRHQPPAHTAALLFPFCCLCPARKAVAPPKHGALCLSRAARPRRYCRPATPPPEPHAHLVGWPGPCGFFLPHLP